MILTEFNEKMALRGCVSDGKNFCGTYKDYPFSVVYTNGSRNGKTSFSLSIQFAQKVPKKMVKQVAKELKGLATVRLMQAVNNIYNVIVTVPKNENFDAAFDRLMEASVQAAQGFALTAPQNCPICKQPGCDSYAFHGTTYQPLHAACVQNQAAIKSAKAMKNEQEGNYATGILGAILGGLVGMLPILLIGVLFGYIFYISGVLIPLGAYYGYKLLRGKMNFVATITTIIVSVLIIPVLSTVLWMATFYTEMGEMLGVGALWETVFAYPEFFLSDIGFIALTVLVGIGVTMSIIKNTNKKAMQEAGYSMATLRPIPGVAPVAAAPVGAAPVAPAAPAPGEPA